MVCQEAVTFRGYDGHQILGLNKEQIRERCDAGAALRLHNLLEGVRSTLESPNKPVCQCHYSIVVVIQCSTIDDRARAAIIKEKGVD